MTDRIHPCGFCAEVGCDGECPQGVAEGYNPACGRLLTLADRCEKDDGLDRRLDYEIMTQTAGKGYAWDPDDANHRYTTSLDAAMSLVPRWLTPTITGHQNEVKLFNGIGYTVRGQDFCSRAPSLPRALTAAALKALASQVQS